MFDMVMFACEPATITAAAVVIGTAVTIAAQAQQAQAQSRFQKKLGAARNKQFQQQTEEAQSRLAQQREAQARRLFAASQESRKARSEARVAAGEAGVGGASVEALLNEFTANQARLEEATIRQDQLNRIGTGARIRLGQTATRAGNVSINRPIAGPDIGQAISNIGGAAADVYRERQQRRGRTLNPRAAQAASIPPPSR